MANNQQLLMGEGAGGAPVVYVEDVFSTYLYTGNGSTQTITNNIDLSTKGGLVWLKQRTIPTGTGQNFLFDSARGIAGGSAGLGYARLSSDTTDAQGTNAQILAYPFNSNGFSLLSDSGGWGPNQNTSSCVSWTFREQPKFFDVVTYTGTGSNTTIAHALGVVPGCIIVKRTDTTAAWAVYHRSLANTQYLVLNTTAAAATGATWWNSTTPTSSVFSVGTDASVNASGGTYVAYIYAHDAGGFGLAGTDNVISCGTFTGNTTVTLGYEPQWILLKRTSGVERWYIIDTMRGWPVSGDANYLAPNTSDAENQTNQIYPNATGFSTLTGGGDFIYVAIRRGPMKVPTVGTSVFSPIAKTGDASTTTVTNVGFPADLFMFKWTALAYGWKQQDRLRGFVQQLASDATSSEASSGTYTFGTVNNTGYTYGANASTSGELNGSGVTSSVLAFQRAPGFFDEVCYTGTAPTAQNLTHNLGIAPEFIIIKRRDASGNWFTGSMFTSTTVTRALLNFNNDQDLNSLYSGQSIFGGQPTSSVFSVGTGSSANAVGGTYVAYLFATCAGVSKVGTYTGTGALLTVNCSFTSGARFVLIKRVDTSGDWYVYDSARGITSGDDPYLLLNSTAAEVTNTNYVDTDTTGFKVTAAAPAGLNASGGTYIFLAIA